ncbi:hypothetical protein ACN28E_01170 [Archangium lansingense]|uniref:hypothetical protein n=1 Tax=Archangium lansingense TaxID=2995310 RepID=UPI003B7A5E6F
MANNESEPKKGRERPFVEPRRESFIISSELMTDDQRRAARQTLELLVWIAEAPARGKRPQEDEAQARAATFLPHIDPERRNHVILIDGERGSGKTALLITMLHVLEQPILKQPIKPGTEEFQELLGNAKGRIVPLEHIDLLPLPEGTNLAMHLTSVLQKVVAAIEADTEPGYGPTLSAPSERLAQSARRELKSRTQWRKLLKSVASGREGNLSQRRAHVDPETYAYELEQAGRERLDLDTSFRAFVDALVADYKHWSGAKEEPLFVIAIDDADMNPQLGLELLELIRTLWHPRVAFVLTGDSRTFLAVLQAKLGGTLKAAGGAPDLLTSRIPTLSQQIYDKTIPPSQRSELEALDKSERLLHVKGLLEQPLTLLRTTPPAGEQRPQRLLDLFELQPQLVDIFPDRLRALRDLADFIQRGSPGTGDEWGRLRHVIQELWDSALHDPRVQPELAEQIKELVQIDKRSRTFVVSTGPFVLRDVPQVIASGFTENDWRVYFLRPRRTEVLTADSKPLSRRLSAALLLVLNTAENVEFGLARVDEQHQTALGAQVEPRVEPPVLIPWPLPDFHTLLDHTLFGLAWETLLPRRFRLESGDVDAIARLFLRTVCWFARNRDGFLEAVLGSADVAWQALRPINIGSEGDTWETTAREIASLTQGPAIPWDRRRRFESWAIWSAGLLAAPESGVSSAGAREFLEGLRRNMERIWPTVLGNLRSRRLEHVARNAYWREQQDPQARRAAAERLIGQIDRMHPTHPWLILIQNQEDLSGVTAPFNPKELFSKVPVSINARSSVHWMSSLADYVSADRNNDLGRLPRELIPSWLAVVNEYGNPAELLNELWKIVTRDDETGLSSLVSYLSAARKLHVDDVNRRIDFTDIVKADNGEFDFTFSQLRLSRDVGMAPYQYALYRIVWDFREDMEDLDINAPPGAPERFSGYWWGFSTNLDPKIVVHWPAVKWPALLDWELMFSDWQRTLNQMLVRLKSGRNELIDYSVDYLGFMYALNVRAVLLGRKSGDFPLSDELNSHDWTLLWRELVDLAKTESLAGARFEAFRKWVDSAPLMAAPESGLSFTAAAGILDALGEINEQTRKNLRKYRRTRLTAGGEAKTEALIRTIDDDRQEHPWVVRVEEPEAPSMPPG